MVTFKTDSIRRRFQLSRKTRAKRQAIYQVQAVQTIQISQKLEGAALVAPEVH